MHYKDIYVYDTSLSCIAPGSCSNCHNYCHFLCFCCTERTTYNTLIKKSKLKRQKEKNRTEKQRKNMEAGQKILTDRCGQNNHKIKTLSIKYGKQKRNSEKQIVWKEESRKGAGVITVHKVMRWQGGVSLLKQCTRGQTHTFLLLPNKSRKSSVGCKHPDTLSYESASTALRLDSLSIHQLPGKVSFYGFTVAKRPTSKKSRQSISSHHLKCIINPN